MKKYVKYIIGVVLVGAFMVCSKPAGPDNNDDTTSVHPWDLLPADNAVTGWVKKDTTKYKVWQDAQHPDDDLSDFINGGAAVYTDKGFVRGTIINYTDQAQDITIYLYEFVNADSAHRLYQSLDPGNAIPPVSGLGQEARLEELLFNAGLEVRQGAYYMKLVIPSGQNDAGQALAGVMVNNILAALAYNTGPAAAPRFRWQGDQLRRYCWSPVEFTRICGHDQPIYF